jgi:hypothetical protein
MQSFKVMRYAGKNSLFVMTPFPGDKGGPGLGYARPLGLGRRGHEPPARQSRCWLGRQCGVPARRVQGPPLLPPTE